MKPSELEEALGAIRTSIIGLIDVFALRLTDGPDPATQPLLGLSKRVADAWHEQVGCAYCQPKERTRRIERGIRANMKWANGLSMLPLNEDTHVLAAGRQLDVLTDPFWADAFSYAYGALNVSGLANAAEQWRGAYAGFVEEPMDVRRALTLVWVTSRGAASLHGLIHGDLVGALLYPALPILGTRGWPKAFPSEWEGGRDEAVEHWMNMRSECVRSFHGAFFRLRACVQGEYGGALPERASSTTALLDDLHKWWHRLAGCPGGFAEHERSAVSDRIRDNVLLMQPLADYLAAHPPDTEGTVTRFAGASGTYAFQEAQEAAWHSLSAFCPDIATQSLEIARSLHADIRAGEISDASEATFRVAIAYAAATVLLEGVVVDRLLDLLFAPTGLNRAEVMTAIRGSVPT